MRNQAASAKKYLSVLAPDASSTAQKQVQVWVNEVSHIKPPLPHLGSATVPGSASLRFWPAATAPAIGLPPGCVEDLVIKTNLLYH